MKNYLLLLLLFFGLSATAQLQYKYSVADKQELKNANSKLVKLENLTEKQAYELGLVYERLYDKYKDTNMVCALKCFNYASCLEAHCEKPIYKTINFKLARIYETGKGIGADTLMAMFYYMGSTDAGLKHLAILRQKHCPKKMHYSLEKTDFYFSDSTNSVLEKMLLGGVEISIPFFIACPCDSAQLNQMMFTIASVLKTHPQLGMELFIGSTEIYGDMVGSIADYIYKQGINGERIIVDNRSRDYHAINGNYNIKLTLLSNEDAEIERKRLNLSRKKIKK